MSRENGSANGIDDFDASVMSYRQCAADSPAPNGHFTRTGVMDV
jgi:hypothetical protein